MLRSLKVDNPRIDQTMSSTTRQQIVHRFTVVGSTNDEAKTLAVAGALHGTIVRSDSQTAGRGRHGRRWESSVGNLYLSYIFRPEIHVRTAAQIGYVAAISVAETIEELAADVVQVTCKWPNDVLVDGKKVCGILAETSVSPVGAVDWIVLGIGLNLTSHPRDARRPATNLRAAFKQFIAADEVFEALTGRLHEWMDSWLDAGFDRIRRAWLNRAWSVDSDITVTLQGRSVTGRLVGLDTEGALILQRVDGAKETVHYGEIFPAETR